LSFCHARGSLLELETQILIAKELAYLDRAASEQLITRCGEVGRMLNALIQSLKTSAEAV
jgi:four helix bundle protein